MYTESYISYYMYTESYISYYMYTESYISYYMYTESYISYYMYTESYISYYMYTESYMDTSCMCIAIHYVYSVIHHTCIYMSVHIMLHVARQQARIRVFCK